MTNKPFEETPLPSAEDVAKWVAAVEAVRAEHPDWTDATIASAIAYAVMTPEVVAEVAEAAAAHALDVVAWTAVIRDLQERFPQWTEQECNDNLIALLRWHMEHHDQPSPREISGEVISDRPLKGPR